MKKGLRLEVNGKGLTLHFLTVVGSTLHNLNNSNSDRDVKGVFTWDQEVTNGMVVPAEQLDNKNMRKEDRAELMAQLNKLFDTEFDGGPPYGGCKNEYVTYFEKYFSNVSMESCYNSIPPRMGKELFIRIN